MVFKAVTSPIRKPSAAQSKNIVLNGWSAALMTRAARSGSKKKVCLGFLSPQRIEIDQP
jgi:hypothetical protein